MPPMWYALDKRGRVLDTCEAERLEIAEAILKASCPRHVYVQSRASYVESRLERGIPEHRRVEDDDDSESDCA